MNKECIDLVEKISPQSTFEEIVKWIREEAGSNNNGYFKTNKENALRLQQVPEEYAELLFKIKEKSPKSYLEVGIGNGGSWLTCSHFNKDTLEVSHAVDNLSYSFAAQKYEEVLFIRSYLSNHIKNVDFFYSYSTPFLLNCNQKYDVIFIDGDHSYQGVKSDYENSIRLLNEGGIMIFHDINSKGAPGVTQFWNEFKSNHKFHEIIHSDTCGIGIFYF